MISSITERHREILSYNKDYITRIWVLAALISHANSFSRILNGSKE